MTAEITFANLLVDDENRTVISDQGDVYEITNMVAYDNSETDDVSLAKALVIKCGERDWRVIDLTQYHLATRH